jgi:hypothetical protein
MNPQVEIWQVDGRMETKMQSAATGEWGNGWNPGMLPGGGRPGSPASSRLQAGNSLPALIHDARNMVAAMDLYCDLLAEPGVLTLPFLRYAGELRLVSDASRRLLDRLALMDAERMSQSFAPVNWTKGPEGGVGQGARGGVESATAARAGLDVPSMAALHAASTGATGALAGDTRPDAHFDARADAFAEADARMGGHADGPANGASSVLPSSQQKPDLALNVRLDSTSPPASLGHRFGNPAMTLDLAQELRANLGLLTALGGAGIKVGITVQDAGQTENRTENLLTANQTGNCAENRTLTSCAVRITGDDLTRVLVNLMRNAAEAMPNGGEIEILLEIGEDQAAITFADSGPGIPEAALETIFKPGFTTRIRSDADARGVTWPAQHRGLGLAIVRSIVAAAGGSVWACNRMQRPSSAELSGDSSPHGAEFHLIFPRVVFPGGKSAVTHSPPVVGNGKPAEVRQTDG